MPNAECPPMPPHRMLCSNTNGAMRDEQPLAASGERLLIPHRDGDIRLLGSAYDLKATYDPGIDPGVRPVLPCVNMQP
jgi:hypothetical protein